MVASTRYYGRERPSVRFPSPRHGRRRPGRTIAVGPLAQLVEQGTFNPKVAGSIPARPIAPQQRGEPIRRHPRMGSETGGLAASSPQKGVTMTDMMDRTLTRASLIRGGAAAGVGLAVGGLMGVAPSFASGATQGDVDILIAAEIAEALAVTTYTNIIFNAPFFT